MSGYIAGVPRHQKILFPDLLDKYVTEDNPIRHLGVGLVV